MDLEAYRRRPLIHQVLESFARLLGPLALSTASCRSANIDTYQPRRRRIESVAAPMADESHRRRLGNFRRRYAREFEAVAVWAALNL